ncbi:MAG: cation diffusion facilitator family transporter [Candidatus Omnitrophota bacterium]
MRSDRYQQIKQVLLLILLLNWGVALAKIIYGLTTHFTSMTADGYHSLSDGASNIIGIIGISIASRPADQDHPYGHKKYETLFSLAIAGLLFFVCFNLLSEGLRHLTHPVSSKINLASFIIMIFTSFVNLFVMNYEYKKGKMLNSDILISDSMHTKADIFTSMSVIVALVAGKLGYPIIDPIITIVIALFIGYVAFSIIKQSSHILCDTAVILEEKVISDIVLAVKGVKACHKIRTRGRIDDIHLDLHVQVNPDMHVDNAHKISYKIEEAIKQNIAGVTDVVVHVEPKE